MVSLRLVGKRKQSTPFLVTVLLLLVITPRLTAFNVAKSWNPGEEHHDFFWLFKVFRRDFRLLRNTAVTAPTSLGKRLPWLLVITISTCAARTRERKTCHTPPGARCAAAKANAVPLERRRVDSICCRISEAHRPVIRVGGGAGFMRNLFSIILMTNRYRCCSAVANESSR